MKISKIFIYSYDGRIREIKFRTSGVNIITGAKSTGKSSILDIVDYCSGRSDCLISAGTISNKASWVGVIFELINQNQIMVIKPLPEKNQKEVSKGFIRTGVNLSIPAYDDLKINTNDEAIILTLGNSINIESTNTYLPENSTRENYKFNFKHTKFYLFQPQNLIANKDFLFYNQSDYWKSLSLKDTLPIILKADIPERRSVFEDIKQTKREIKILEKKIAGNQENLYRENQNLLSLFKEAEIYGISRNDHEDNIYKLLSILENISFRSISFNDPSIKNITNIQSRILHYRRQRNNLILELNSIKNFQEQNNTFIKNKNKEFSKIAVLNSFLLKNINEDSDFNSLIKLLDDEFKCIKENYISNSLFEANLKISKIENNINKKIFAIDNNIKQLNNELAIQNEVNQNYKNLANQERGINILIGKIRFYLLNHKDSNNLADLKNQLLNHKSHLETLINTSNGFQDPTSLLDSIIFRISSKLSNYLKALSYEHSKNPTRFDLKQLTLFSTDEFDEQIPMVKVGSGANYLALHIATLLSLHYHFYKLSCSVPSFIIFDQPTQVFFPPIVSVEDIEALKENPQKYNENVDVKEVIKLFKFLIDFTKTEVPDFQIIITEHAYINEPWFRECMVEEQWIPPLALIPESWPSRQNI
ncbi:DUF3732 domain-containing protein [Acinetobacter baumannii]|uniref:DUF3732 domain-containing protein n=1 Tax=Acinetobacter baumannii TaxID=470 RepID=UPI001C0E0E4D|nr:DUF3732 domain-containing protein [Acinetobacter baumannii]MBU3096318.1 DUF3732 domain-containing protein [Acinetobacter baumannii]MCS6738593.1 DUF3732 domain-containing protein [Acinetobacter baumannii]MDC5578940.1 DUF3732 domain-containing protein [Acinetobacter baumannii]